MSKLTDFQIRAMLLKLDATARQCALRGEGVKSVRAAGKAAEYRSELAIRARDRALERKP
jgi:hypothetical protein